MIFGYSIAEAKKFVITAITFVGGIVAMFIAYNPNINEAAITLAGAIIALVGVFLEPQFSIDDFGKGLKAVTGAAISLANFWLVINPSTEMEIYSGIGTVIAVVTILYAKNEKPHNVPTIARHG